VLEYINYIGTGLSSQRDFLYFSMYCPALYDQIQDGAKILEQTQDMYKDINEINKWILFYVVIAGLSMVASLVVALTIFTNKKLKEHPNMLIAFLSIANFLSCTNLLVYIIGTPDFVCYFGLASLY
jgi:hypothetical protein